MTINDKDPKEDEVAVLNEEGEPQGEPQGEEAVEEGLGETEDERTPALRNKGGQANTQSLAEPSPNGRTCCSLAMEIISCVCLLFMSFLFICGSSFKHSRAAASRPKKQALFFTFGGLFFSVVAVLELVQNVRRGPLKITFSSLRIACGVLWFIASIFLIDEQETLKPKVFYGLWLFGTFLNLASVTYAIVDIFISKKAKRLFRCIFVLLEWLANFLFIVGSVQALAALEGVFETSCDALMAINNFASQFIGGSVLYVFAAVFYTLSLFLNGITISVTFARNVPEDA